MAERTLSDYDWQAALRELQWSKAELARRMGIHRNTVVGWGRRAPRYAESFLRLCLDVHRIKLGLN